jgi:hypothetical protein
LKTGREVDGAAGDVMEKPLDIPSLDTAREMMEPLGM